MYNMKLRNNPLKSKSDAADALLELLRPLEGTFGAYGMSYSTGYAHYDQKIGEIEALLRPLWGIVPFVAGGGQYAHLGKYLAKIADGVNPEHSSYWGVLKSEDQRMVEMAALAFGMCMSKQNFWDIFSKEEQNNMYNWLYQINNHPIHMSNWRFFRVLVNIAFFCCGREYSKGRLDEDLAAIHSMYDSDGWYKDGTDGRRDYYNPFAFHFYGLTYAKFATFDNENSKIFTDRAFQFCRQFAAWFAPNGEAVPYGRSLTYRFAMSSLWGALACFDAEVLPWGQIKHMALQNLRRWFSRDIFTQQGELTVGYHYPNQIAAEAYNSFGSPYWAMKAFAFLAVPDGHPFWQAKEEKPDVPPSLKVGGIRGIFQRDSTQVQFFTVGNGNPWMSLAQHKYEKFVYSTHFGFSVPKAAVGLSQGAFDNTLAVCENDNFYRMRFGLEEHNIYDDYLYSKWKPWPDVTIDSYIVPLMPWHVRLHVVDTNRALTLADGGFAISRDGDFKKRLFESSCDVIRDMEISSITSLAGYKDAMFVLAEPNTNIINPRTLIPTLTAKITPGQHVFISAILGVYGEDAAKQHKNPPLLTLPFSAMLNTCGDSTAGQPDNPPPHALKGSGYIITHNNKQITISI